MAGFATMGTLAFALRPWVNKIFDPQGKPRDANALIDDVVWLFKVWDEGKSNSKLNFKFQTPEEGKLCKELISLFGLGGKGSSYSDVTSLKDARFAITGDFLVKKNNPLWTIKYAPSSAFSHLPVIVTVNDDMKRLADNIVRICEERELRNPALVKETLELIGEQRMEMKNVLNVDTGFQRGLQGISDADRPREYKRRRDRGCPPIYSRAFGEHGRLLDRRRGGNGSKELATGTDAATARTTDDMDRGNRHNGSRANRRTTNPRCTQSKA